MGGEERVFKDLRNLKCLGKLMWLELPWFAPQERGQMVPIEEDICIVCHKGSSLCRPCGEGEG